jgi:hypothetical protein
LIESAFAFGEDKKAMWKFEASIRLSLARAEPQSLRPFQAAGYGRFSDEKSTQLEAAAQVAFNTLARGWRDRFQGVGLEL